MKAVMIGPLVMIATLFPVKPLNAESPPLIKEERGSLWREASV
jgi:hypothetical protein